MKFKSTFISAILTNSSFILFQKTVWNFFIFYDYVIGHDVIGHDVIGHPEVGTDNSGLGLYGIENRLAIGSLR